MRVTVKDKAMAAKAKQLLDKVFTDSKYFDQLEEWLFQYPNAKGFKQHVTEVAGSNYAAEVVTGVQVVALLAATEVASPRSSKIYAREMRRTATSFLKGKHRYLLPRLKAIGADLPAWLEQR